ncbi:hypothetical protein FGG08_000809 [Glutinoglossum americanum]|uniref:Actin binding protein n=1 Tax=Glutinoglossum americanum TaxID=1670608 RepID=A0A9P8L0U4_9PEZI|nr:hypothetical protein FGG08_000809 [Glutinoglossum americanum]
MAALNLSTNGPSITRSYQSVVNSNPPTGPAASSQTYGQWAILSVSAPLVNAFTQDAGGKESVLKVQSTGEGELADLIDELSDGRIQFAFVKVKDTNTALPKFVLIGWCGEGVPERTKGYFTSHLAAVSRILHGYHVQITARSDRDLTPEGIIQKVADASGSKYSSTTTPGLSGPPPPIASKPAFTPTRVGGGGGGFNPLSGSRPKPATSKDRNTDDDGWGEDAPPVTRTQLEKVQSAYRPTKVNMSELTAQKQEPSRFSPSGAEDGNETPGVVKGTYQPVGKVDIAAIRRQAHQSGSSADDRPTVVKGAYEPVGKVDIAAIRAKAQPRPSESSWSPPSNVPPATTGRPAQSSDGSASKSLFPQPERLTTLVKPKVVNRFGSGANSFAGTKAPLPGAFGLESSPAPAAPVGAASRTFADEGGKTPAQIWAERKARERGLSGAGENPPTSGIGVATSPIEKQKSGGEWKSGYSGKSWAPIQTNTTGRSSGSSGIGQQRTGPDEQVHDEPLVSPAGGIGALRDRFKGAAPMGAPPIPSQERSVPSPPPLDVSSKPNAGGVHGGVAIPGLPIRPSQSAYEREEEEVRHHTPAAPPPPAQRISPSPSPPRSPSPIRIAQPIARSEEARIESPAERSAPKALPAESLSQSALDETHLADESGGYGPAHGATEPTAAASFDHIQPPTGLEEGGGKRALVQFDYEKAEDNELELKEGEYVTDIDMVDVDWWMGRNSKGETGLFPASYVELVEDLAGQPKPDEDESHAEPSIVVPAPNAGKLAIAIYDYEAAEDNELSFAEGTKITGIEFPDDDWWFGEAGGKSGLFPANYVELQK